MSSEAPKNIDFDSEIGEFIANKLGVLETERAKRQKAEEELHLKIERANQERRLILAAGNTRAKEIIQESGLRDMLEQTKRALLKYYPSATLAEREDILVTTGGSGEYRKISYEFRLGWKPIPENARINIWDPHELGDGQEFHFFDVMCSGWEPDRTKWSYKSRVVKDTLMGEHGVSSRTRPYESYERKDSLFIICGLPDGIRFWDENQWRDSEKLKMGIVEAIKNPCVVMVPYNRHEGKFPHYG